MAAATVTSKGQVTLPVEARRRLEVVRVGGSVRELKGLLPRPRRRLSLEEMEDAIAKGARGRSR